MASTSAKMPQGPLACQSRVTRCFFLELIDGANSYPKRPECELVDSQLQRNDFRVERADIKYATTYCREGREREGREKLSLFRG